MNLGLKPWYPNLGKRPVQKLASASDALTRASKQMRTDQKDPFLGSKGLGELSDGSPKKPSEASIYGP